MEEREKNLPKWAQELIADLRKRIQVGNEPVLREISRLRPMMEKLTAENEAYHELLDCAARGGHKTAQQIVEVLSQYDIVKR